jgi:hypothetical protein
MLTRVKKPEKRKRKGSGASGSALKVTGSFQLLRHIGL